MRHFLIECILLDEKEIYQKEGRMSNISEEKQQFKSKRAARIYRQFNDDSWQQEAEINTSKWGKGPWIRRTVIALLILALITFTIQFFHIGSGLSGKEYRSAMNSLQSEYSSVFGVKDGEVGYFNAKIYGVSKDRFNVDVYARMYIEIYKYNDKTQKPELSYTSVGTDKPIKMNLVYEVKDGYFDFITVQDTIPMGVSLKMLLSPDASDEALDKWSRANAKKAENYFARKYE